MNGAPWGAVVLRDFLLLLALGIVALATVALGCWLLAAGVQAVLA